MEPKTKQQLKIMTKGGEILALVVEEVLKAAKPGIKTSDLDKLAEAKITSYGAQASFKLVPRYHWATCMCVNDTVVHGIPTAYTLQEGDLLGVDIGVYYQGFHTDMSWTIRIGQKEMDKFLQTGQKALLKAIEQVKAGNRVGHISQAIETVIEKEGGYSVVKQLVGHGVGRQLHEEPQIPGIVTKPIEQTPVLISGQTLALEIIYAHKKGDIVYKNNDGWTLVTKDGSLAGLYEVTVAVRKDKPLILTPFAGLLNQ